MYSNRIVEDDVLVLGPHSVLISQNARLLFHSLENYQNPSTSCFVGVALIRCSLTSPSLSLSFLQLLSSLERTAARLPIIGRRQRHPLVLLYRRLQSRVRPTFSINYSRASNAAERQVPPPPRALAIILLRKVACACDPPHVHQKRDHVNGYRLRKCSSSRSGIVIRITSDRFHGLARATIAGFSANVSEIV